MDLNDYMQQKNIKNHVMARDLKLSPGFICKLRKKKANPTLYNAFLITRYCKGQVSLPELVSQQAFDEFVFRRNLDTFNLSILINPR